MDERTPASMEVESLDAAPPEYGLAWGIRRSLVDYAHGLRDGVIAVGGGVIVAPEFEFHFPLDTSDFDVATGSGVVRFRGAVQFTGHAGLMSFTFSNPWLHTEATRGSLSVDSLDGTGSRTTLLEIQSAQFEEDGKALRWVALQPTLTEPGAAALDFFPAGTAFDALCATVPPSR